jgi:hypothetical protein
MKTIRRILDGLDEIESWADFFDKLGETDQVPVVVYGLYDAVWPTIGVEGHAWFCLHCGRNNDEFSSSRVALAAGEAHGDVYHPGVDLTFTEVFPDREEIR